MEAPCTFVFERNDEQIIIGPMCFQSGMQGMDPSLLKFTRGIKVLGVGTMYYNARGQWLFLTIVIFKVQ